LNNAGLSELTEFDFEDAKNQQLAKVLFQSLDQESKDPAQFIQEDHQTELDELIMELTTFPQDKSNTGFLKMNEQKQVEEIMRSLLLLRQMRNQMELNQLQAILNEALQNQEEDTPVFQKQITNHIFIRGKLDQALADPLQQAKTANV
jgi:hypothetical protein